MRASDNPVLRHLFRDFPAVLKALQEVLLPPSEPPFSPEIRERFPIISIPPTPDTRTEVACQTDLPNEEMDEETFEIADCHTISIQPDGDMNREEHIEAIVISFALDMPRGSLAKLAKLHRPIAERTIAHWHEQWSRDRTWRPNHTNRKRSRRIFTSEQENEILSDLNETFWEPSVKVSMTTFAARTAFKKWKSSVIYVIVLMLLMFPRRYLLRAHANIGSSIAKLPKIQNNLPVRDASSVDSAPGITCLFAPRH
jgi:hypothetical protein